MPRALIEGIAAAAVIYVVGGFVEAGLIALIHPTTVELTWISDAVVAGAFGVAVYLWRHLQATRFFLSEYERRSLLLQTQLALAADLQRRLLPDMPPPTDRAVWAASLVPAGDVGGDFYDVLEISPGDWMALVADVSGKGIAAAMALALVRSIFRSLARADLGPADLVTRLSAALYQEWRGAPYITCVVASVDSAAGTISYASAGHPPALIVRSDATVRLDSSGPPAGLLPDCVYQQVRLDLRQGDACVFVTDGITEALSDDLGLALDRVAAAARQAGGAAAAVCDGVMTLAATGPGPSGVDQWEDDRTVLVLSIR